MKITFLDRGVLRQVVVDAESLTIEQPFNGFAVLCDQGTIGIAQRDGGIEVMVNGRPVWSSVHGDLRLPAGSPVVLHPQGDTP